MATVVERVHTSKRCIHLQD